MTKERSRYSDDQINSALDALADAFVNALPPGEAKVDRQRWGVALRHSDAHVYVTAYFEWNYDRDEAVISYRKGYGKGGQVRYRVGNPESGLNSKKIAKVAKDVRTKAEQTIQWARRSKLENAQRELKQERLAEILTDALGGPSNRDGQDIQWSNLNLSAKLGLADYGAGFATFAVSIPTAYVREFAEKFRPLLEDILARPLITPEAK